MSRGFLRSSCPHILNVELVRQLQNQGLIVWEEGWVSLLWHKAENSESKEATERGRRDARCHKVGCLVYSRDLEPHGEERICGVRKVEQMSSMTRVRPAMFNRHH